MESIEAFVKNQVTEPNEELEEFIGEQLLENIENGFYTVYTEEDKRLCTCCKQFLVNGDPGLIVSKWRSTIFDSNPYCQSCTDKIKLFQRRTGRRSYNFETDILNPPFDSLQKCTRSLKHY